VKVPSLGSFVTTTSLWQASEYDQPRDSPTPGRYIHIVDYFLPNPEANNGGEKEGGTLHNS